MAGFLDKFTSILTTILQVESQVANTVPLVHVGTAGEVLGFSVVAEESLLVFLSALKQARVTTIPVMTPPAPAATAPVPDIVVVNPTA